MTPQMFLTILSAYDQLKAGTRDSGVGVFAVSKSTVNL